MQVIKKELRVLSSDGIHTLAGVVFCPVGAPRGLLHVVHGMTEHIGRYERFMRELAAAGWLCFGYDNLGHGNTAADESELGYIAKKGGWELLAKDVKVFSDEVKAQYGAEALPYCLMGHSMGSFIVRLAAERYVRPDRLIVMGTGGKNGAAGAGLALIALIRLFCGDRHISPLVDRLAFGSYNKRFADECEDREAPNPWLTTDREVRARYAADPFCTFRFTVSAMGDLIRLMKEVNRGAWYRKLSPAMPILLVSGEEDPVGNYGKGVLEVRDGLARQGLDVTCVLYEGARHEILNDVTYERVVADILAFLG